MVVLQPGEQVVATLKRHPIGIVSVYVGAAMGLLVAAGLAFFLVPHLAAQYNVAGDVLHIVYGVFGFLAVGMLLMVAVSSNVYWQNEWVVTTDSITEITQKSLLGRQVSELSMEHIEDVTVDQSGVLQHMFNFGTLKVETAGERSKFVFPYCPNPNQSARVILEARERFTNGHEGH